MKPSLFCLFWGLKKKRADWKLLFLLSEGLEGTGKCILRQRSCYIGRGKCLSWDDSKGSRREEVKRGIGSVTGPWQKKFQPGENSESLGNGENNCGCNPESLISVHLRASGFTSTLPVLHRELLLKLPQIFEVASQAMQHEALLGFIG